jgi:hypothetical protein
LRGLGTQDGAAGSGTELASYPFTLLVSQ